MSTSTTVHVKLKGRSYPIKVQQGLLNQGNLHLDVFSQETDRLFLVFDPKLMRVAKIFQRKFRGRIAGMQALRGGEHSKQLASMATLYGSAAKARLDRRAIVIAIGGGVVGDVAGFFAATYLRGIRIIQVPTTVIAQVDSSIGGKTGINLPRAKNLVGAFHQPSAILVDPQLLKTLPQREFISGLAEVIKTGVIADLPLFLRLEKNLLRILRRDPDELTWIIERCCALKARVVSRDEFETTGLRAILNFGHTIGHGIEAAAKYKLLHGEAIALGMIGAGMLSQELLGFKTTHQDRMNQLIKRSGLPTRLPAWIRTDDILDAMKLDKKASKGRMQFVLAQRIGKVQTRIPVSEQKVQSVIERLRLER